MSPDYFADQFLEFGFDAVFASRFPRSADVALDEGGILNPEDKPRIAARFCDLMLAYRAAREWCDRKR